MVVVGLESSAFLDSLVFLTVINILTIFTTTSIVINNFTITIIIGTSIAVKGSAGR